MRGQGYPIEIKRKIAEHFAENGYNKKSRKVANEIYAKMSATDKKMDPYVLKMTNLNI